MKRLRWPLRITPTVLLLAAAPLLMGSECEKPLVKDSGFDLWCGDVLCDWQVVPGTGSVAKVPTWNQHDYGVDLQGSLVTLTQLLPSTSDQVSCLHFNLLVDITDPVNVTLDLDFNDDGSVEQRETLSFGSWTPIEFRISAPTYFQSLRVSITKHGDGHAVLAQIRASSASDCTDPPLSTLNRPLGATCESVAECAQGSCLPRALAEQLLPDASKTRMACEACAGEADCGAGTVCGLGWNSLLLDGFASCTAAGSRVLGDRCLAAAECTTGICCGGVCSSCCTDLGAGCPVGTTCAERARDNKLPLRSAWQCSPGGQAGVANTPCLGNADCVSDACVGGAPFSVCALDGRRCLAGTDCPSLSEGNACIPLGVADGRCQ
jgi:hypothetical protein